MYLPVPRELTTAVAEIKAWAGFEALIAVVVIFGSRLRGTNRPDSDLDVAVSLAASECDWILYWTDNKRRWQRDLSARVGLTVDLDLAHPRLAPELWRYLQEGHALAYSGCLRQGCDIHP